MKKWKKKLTLILVVAVLISVNVAMFFLPGYQIDLTINKINSLSKPTKEVIWNLKDIVYIKVLVTKELPSEVKTLYADMKTILTQMGRVNPNRLRVQFIDPSSSPANKEEADKYGITELQFSSIKSDKFEVQKGYFGLAIVYGDKKEVLPVASDVGNIEYFIVSGIKKLIDNQAKTVALIEDKTNGSSFEIFKKYLQRSYQLNMVEMGDKIDLPSADVLLILGHNFELSDSNKKEMESWVNRGKGVVAMVDKYLVSANMNAKRLTQNGVLKWLEEYGINTGEGLVVDDNSLVANFKRGSSNFLIKYPYWVSISDENINHSLPVMSGINNLSVFWGSPLTVQEGAKPLFMSSSKSSIDDALNDLSPSTKTTSEKEKDRQIMAAINTSDNFKVALVADSEMVSDTYLPNNQQNLLFGLNLVDYFAQDTSLYQIRNKLVYVNQLKSVSESTKLTLKIINILLPLLAWLILFFIFNRRE